MKMKSPAAALCCFCLLLTGCGMGNGASTHASNNAKADYPYYGTLEEMVEKASLIVHGSIVSTRVEEGADAAGDSSAHADVHTIYSVAVTDVYKGDCLEGDTIEVAQYGKEGVGVWYEDFAPLEDGADYVWFLTPYNDIEQLLNPAQGCYLYAKAEETGYIDELVKTVEKQLGN